MMKTEENGHEIKKELIMKRVSWLCRIAIQKRLFIIRGPSGSGKSIISKELSKKFNAPIFSTDDYWMKDGKYIFDIKKLGKAHEWNRHRTEAAMSENIPVIIIDNTNVKFWEMRAYVLLANKYDYDVIFKEPDWDSRLKTFDDKWNIDFLEEMQNNSDREKSLPRQILEKMVNNYEYNPTIELVLNSSKPF